VHDHSSIVWDEIVGYLVTMIMSPTGWYWMVLGFILFRLFDICKPWPVSWADKRVAGGLGIMLDDLIAAIYALLLLQITAYLL
jgi:phosphatidylglycerophosphatase A